MTKEEKIKEAYASKYHLVKASLDENGWMPYNILTNAVFDSLEFNFSHDKKRPYCLKGIENNRGWIKIESEEDLPKEDIECWIKEKGNEIIFNGRYISLLNYFAYTAFQIDNVTHYQPITKPEPPLY